LCHICLCFNYIRSFFPFLVEKNTMAPPPQEHEDEEIQPKALCLAEFGTSLD
jgi:hypothetical protein